jgi:RimJ/RimL family protein N-acetyltransferase
MSDSDQFIVEKLAPPYRKIDVQVLPEQEQFIDSVEKALSILTDGELPFAVQTGELDVGFFTLRPSDHDEVEQLRGAFRCTLRSFMIDARLQGKGFASKALAKLPDLMAAHFPQAKSIGLTVNCRNKAAHRLYEKNGFRDLDQLFHGGSAGPQHIMIMELN